MKLVHILLVEDNEGDIMLIKDAFEDAKILSTIDSVNNGEKAVQYLNKESEYAGIKTPDLIILDINLPRLNGHEVLQYIKTSNDLRHIPVIMLTTSSSEKDINNSYRERANCYITKPVEINNFLYAINRIEEFWINLVKLPGRAF